MYWECKLWTDFAKGTDPHWSLLPLSKRRKRGFEMTQNVSHFIKSFSSSYTYLSEQTSPCVSGAPPL